MFLTYIKPINQYIRSFTLSRLLEDEKKIIENDFRLKDNHNQCRKYFETFN